MCPGWPRASSAARCPRRAVAITCLPTWRWSRRRRSSSCCCSSSSWRCSSCAVSASCWTPTAACPRPTGQTTPRRTRSITASSEGPQIGKNLKNNNNYKRLIWCLKSTNDCWFIRKTTAFRKSWHLTRISTSPTASPCQIRKFSTATSQIIDQTTNYRGPEVQVMHPSPPFPCHQFSRGLPRSSSISHRVEYLLRSKPVGW